MNIMYGIILVAPLYYGLIILGNPGFYSTVNTVNIFPSVVGFLTVGFWIKRFGLTGTAKWASVIGIVGCIIRMVAPMNSIIFLAGGVLMMCATIPLISVLPAMTLNTAEANMDKPDALIIAAGSSPLRPPIPGLDGENVILVNDQYKQEKPITDSVVVFGGGISGVECTIHMGMEGKTVHLVEMRDDVALDSMIRQRPLLLEKLYKLCSVHTGYKGLEVTKDGIWCQTKEGEKVLVPGTTVICALGQRPRWDTVKELYDCAPWVRVIGDANAVGTITKATYQGHHAALDI